MGGKLPPVFAMEQEESLGYTAEILQISWEQGERGVRIGGKLAGIPKSTPGESGGIKIGG